MSNKVSSNHHTVPQFYLKGFRDESGKMTVWHRKDGKISHHPVKKIAKMPGYYNILTDDGNESDIVEEIYSKIELRASRTFTLMTGALHLMPRFLSEDRLLLSDYLALQFVRTLKFRRSSQLLYDYNWKMMTMVDLLNSKEPLTKAQARFLNDPHLVGEFAQTQDALTIQELNSIREVSPLLFYRPWMLIVFNKDVLITSDCPVFLYPFPGCPAGLGTAAEIWFPMNSRHLLVLGNPVSTYPLRNDKIVYQSTSLSPDLFSKISEYSNNAQLKNSYLEAYGSHDNIIQYKDYGLGEKLPISFGNDSDFNRHYSDTNAISLQPIMGYGEEISKILSRKKGGGSTKS